MQSPVRAEVTSGELEKTLRALSATVEDPRAGLFGPESALWSVNRHTAIFLGSGRAALLQLAHPWVAQAIADHSKTRSDPYGRFQRTFRRVFAMVFGDLDTALAAARRVHALHGTIRGSLDEKAGPWQSGSDYAANQRQALLWVHSTLWETSVVVHEAVLGPLEPETKEAYYRDTRRFAALFGLAPEELPADWRAFVDSNRRMWDSAELEVSGHARKIGRFLFTPPDPLFSPLADWFRNLTTGFLPEPLREPFGLPFGVRRERAFRRSLKRLRWLLPTLPRRLRYLPPYLEAEQRLAGRGTDRLTRLMSRLYVGEG